MRYIHRVPCAGARRPIIAVRHGEGILDTIIQTANNAASKVTSAAPDLVQKVISSGKAAVVPAATRAGQAAGRAVAERAATLLQRVSKKDAALPSITRVLPLPRTAQKALTKTIQERAQALLSSNLSNLINGQGLRLSPY